VALPDEGAPHGARNTAEMAAITPTRISTAALEECAEFFRDFSRLLLGADFFI
jgi:hypothetical protein